MFIIICLQFHFIKNKKTRDCIHWIQYCKCMLVNTQTNTNQIGSDLTKPSLNQLPNSASKYSIFKIKCLMSYKELEKLLFSVEWTNVMVI